MRTSLKTYVFVTVAALAAFLVVPAQSAMAGPECPGDVNGDDAVNIGDLIVVFMNYGCTESCEGDANGDGAVDIHDVIEVIVNFGPCDGEGCESNEACEDDDPCTYDLCIGGTCWHIPIPGPDCNGDG